MLGHGEDRPREIDRGHRIALVHRPGQDGGQCRDDLGVHFRWRTASRSPASGGGQRARAAMATRITWRTGKVWHGKAPHEHGPGLGSSSGLIPARSEEGRRSGHTRLVSLRCSFYAATSRSDASDRASANSTIESMSTVLNVNLLADHHPRWRHEFRRVSRLGRERSCRPRLPPTVRCDHLQMPRSPLSVRARSIESTGSPPRRGGPAVRRSPRWQVEPFGGTRPARS